MTVLSNLDGDEMALWLSRSNVRVDTMRVKVPDEEAELDFANGRLEVRQAGGLVGVFEGTQAAELIEAAASRRRPPQTESPPPGQLHQAKSRKHESPRQVTVAGVQGH